MCNERERLIGYVYEECDTDERRLVDLHLETCQTCQEEIGGLRAAREDLLAWEVPEHDSVWRPFAPARAVPWWREVPAWAMAAAASVMFAVGAAGGAMTHAFVADRPAEPASATQHVSAPAGVTASDLAALEQRLASSVQRDLGQVNQRLQLVTMRPAPTGDRVNATTVAAAPELADRVAGYYALSDRQFDMSLKMNNSLGELFNRLKQQENANRELTRQLSQLQAVVFTQSAAPVR